MFSVLPADSLLMKNKEGLTPIQSLLLASNETHMNLLCLYYKDKGICLNDIRDQNNQNLLHHWARSSSPSHHTINGLLNHGVDPNAVDNFKKTPLHYLVKHAHNDYNCLLELGNRMNSTALNQEDENGKLAFTYFIEDLLFKHKSSFALGRAVITLSPQDELNVERLMDKGCDILTVFQGINIGIAKQGHIILNGALSLIALINIPLIAKTRPILKALCTELARYESLDNLLVTRLDFSHIELEQSLRNVPINALSMLLWNWCVDPQPLLLMNNFKGKRPILSDRCFSNIFDADTGIRCDFLYYFLAGRFDLANLQLYVSGFYNYQNSWQGYDYFTTHIIKRLTFHHLNGRELNVLQLCCKLDNVKAFFHFKSIQPYQPQDFVDIIAENGDSFGSFIDQYPKVKWNPEHISK